MVNQIKCFLVIKQECPESRAVPISSLRPLVELLQQGKSSRRPRYRTKLTWIQRAQYSWPYVLSDDKVLYMIHIYMICVE